MYIVDFLLLNVLLLFVYGLFYNNCLRDEHGTAKFLSCCRQQSSARPTAKIFGNSLLFSSISNISGCSYIKGVQLKRWISKNLKTFYLSCKQLNLNFIKSDRKAQFACTFQTGCDTKLLICLPFAICIGCRKYQPVNQLSNIQPEHYNNSRYNFLG